MKNDDRTEERERMVVRQIERRGISDKRVLTALRTVPRHIFTRAKDAPYAYSDQPLSIGEGQTISQPYIVAYMTYILKVTDATRVLEIGTGSGYQTAILASLSREVISLERIPKLAERARKLLCETLGYSNISVITGDGSCGYKKAAPYDRIIVTAAAPTVPQSLIDQLDTDGIMVIPVGSRHLQELYVVRRTKKTTRHDATIGCRFVPLIGKEGWD